MLAEINYYKCNNVNMYIKPTFANNQFYHIYNRGVNKAPIFDCASDYQRFLDTCSFYLEKNNLRSFSNSTNLKEVLNTFPIDPLVKIHVYCLIPNHFHLIIEQLLTNGISTFIRRAIDSYTRYYNVKYQRVGPLFQGKFKATHISSDEYLLNVSRYVHLNPFLNNLTEKPENYTWSSYRQYLKEKSNRLCSSEKILDMIGDPVHYKSFVDDYKDYARSLEYIKKLTLE